MKTLRISARKSNLARLQAYEVGTALAKAAQQAGFGELKITYQFRTSLGDQRADDPLWKMPERGVFTEDFVADLIDGHTDLVVHSWKDLPIAERAQTVVVATRPRADSQDVLLVRSDRWANLWSQPKLRMQPFRVLTSSPRRVYNLPDFIRQALPFGSRSVSTPAPEIEFLPVRGNIATRVRKLLEPSALASQSPDALVVAKAALDRLVAPVDGIVDDPVDRALLAEAQLEMRAAISCLRWCVLPLTVNPTAAAQGALALEINRNREDLKDLCRLIDSPMDRELVELERRELARHGGGCHQKIGVSFMQRPYGQIHFLRGLTDAGEVLREKSVTPNLSDSVVQAWPRALAQNEIYTGGRRDVLRKALATAQVSDAIKRHEHATHDQPRTDSSPGYFVTRKEAWPAMSLSPLAVIWTSGLTTWQELAGRGVWVHGSSESLGDREDLKVDALVGARVRFLRLTHDPTDAMSLQTYALERGPLDRQALKTARFFYWMSGSQFLEAVNEVPEILNSDRYHACGPGRTWDVVQSHVKSPGHCRVFLTLEEFRSHI